MKEIGQEELIEVKFVGKEASIISINEYMMFILSKVQGGEILRCLYYLIVIFCIIDANFNRNCSFLVKLMINCVFYTAIIT